jgi:hypothetical protein
MCHCRERGGTLKLNVDGKETSAECQERQVAAKARMSPGICPDIGAGCDRGCTGRDCGMAGLLRVCLLPMQTQNIFSSTYHIEFLDVCIEH